MILRKSLPFNPSVSPDLSLQATCCFLHQEDGQAALIRHGKHLQLWNNDTSRNLWIDRFDVRCMMNLYEDFCSKRNKIDIEEYDFLESSEINIDMIFERYRDLEDSNKLVPFEEFVMPDEVVPATEYEIFSAIQQQEEYFISDFLTVPSTITIPGTKKLFDTIVHTAKNVRARGTQLEILLKVRHADDGRFAFLHEDSEFHEIYKLLLSVPDQVFWNVVLEQRKPEGSCTENISQQAAVQLLNDAALQPITGEGEMPSTSSFSASSNALSMIETYFDDNDVPKDDLTSNKSTVLACLTDTNREEIGCSDDRLSMEYHDNNEQVPVENISSVAASPGDDNCTVQAVSIINNAEIKDSIVDVVTIDLQIVDHSQKHYGLDVTESISENPNKGTSVASCSSVDIVPCNSPQSHLQSSNKYQPLRVNDETWKDITRFMNIDTDNNVALNLANCQSAMVPPVSSTESLLHQAKENASIFDAMCGMELGFSESDDDLWEDTDMNEFWGKYHLRKYMRIGEIKEQRAVAKKRERLKRAQALRSHFSKTGSENTTLKQQNHLLGPNDVDCTKSDRLSLKRETRTTQHCATAQSSCRVGDDNETYEEDCKRRRRSHDFSRRTRSRSSVLRRLSSRDRDTWTNRNSPVSNKRLRRHSSRDSRSSSRSRHGRSTSGGSGSDNGSCSSSSWASSFSDSSSSRVSDDDETNDNDSVAASNKEAKRRSSGDVATTSVIGRQMRGSGEGLLLAASLPHSDHDTLKALTMHEKIKAILSQIM